MRKLSRRSILRAVAAVSASVMLTACGAYRCFFLRRF